MSNLLEPPSNGRVTFTPPLRPGGMAVSRRRRLPESWPFRRPRGGPAWKAPSRQEDGGLEGRMPRQDGKPDCKKTYKILLDREHYHYIVLCVPKEVL